MWNQVVGEYGRGLAGASLVGWQPGLGGPVQGSGSQRTHAAAFPLTFLSTGIHCFLEVTVQSPEDQEKPGRIGGIWQNS